MTSPGAQRINLLLTIKLRKHGLRVMENSSKTFKALMGLVELGEVTFTTETDMGRTWLTFSISPKGESALEKRTK